MAFAFEKLDVFRKAIDFGTTVIDVVERMNAPRNHFRLIEQLEAAATSVAMNIAEGKGRYSKKEFRHFLYIARGSLYETIALLQILLKLKWIDLESYQNIYAGAEEISKMLAGLIHSIGKTPTNTSPSEPYQL
jgi:four helix bundle protein